MLHHPIPPIYDNKSTILILGSFPSVRSREVGFFYGHQQNRFWKVTSSVFQVAEPQTIEEKRQFLLYHGIALWDVAASCEIHGSSDSSLRQVIPNDLAPILSCSPIKQIFLNGKTAAHYYDRLIKPAIKRDATVLPSTSPANASWSQERLIEAWHVLLEK